MQCEAIGLNTLNIRVIYIPRRDEVNINNKINRKSYKITLCVPTLQTDERLW